MKLNCFLYLVLIFCLCVSCSPGKNETAQKTDNDSATVKKTNADFMFDCGLLKKDALKMDSIILKQTETNVKVANEAIKAFTEFAYRCSSDSVAPVYLIKTAQIAQAVNNTPQAKVVLEKCINDYPNFKNRAAAIFLLAQLYDEAAYLDNEEQAKILYQKIIDEYPKSDWTVSAKGALKFIGKSDQQIIEEFNKRKSNTTQYQIPTTSYSILTTKMKEIPKQFITIGLLGALAVALGALGAHFLKGKLETGLITMDQVNGFDTGVKYHIYHVLAMLIIVILKNFYSSKFLNIAYMFFLWGIILFSGSLYFLCTRNLLGADWLKFLGPITPIGGLGFVAGWLCLCFAGFQKKA